MHLIEVRIILFAICLFAGVLLAIETGRLMGIHAKAKLKKGDAPHFGSVEAAVFGLLGLMIAFTFQGAASRFDARRSLIVEEANIISTAWLRIDLLPRELQPTMRKLFRVYLDSRLETYKNVYDVDKVKASLQQTEKYQNEIWKVALAGQAVIMGLMPLLNEMFDIVMTRTMATKMHPPLVVYLMLAFLACAAALMAGYSMSGTMKRSLLHTVGFAVILTITAYVILDMEYPRYGWVRVEAFDQVLINMREGFQ